MTAPDGSVESAEGSWEAGVDGAKPGKFYVKGVGLVFENDVTGPPEYNRLVAFTK